MSDVDPNSEPLDELDALIREFAASGYAPSGAEIADDHAPHGDGHGHDAGVRRVEYRGHAIEIVTTYAVTIDGEPWDGRIDVGIDGTVTYHGLPQYVVPSAVDLIRSVIDTVYEAPEDVRQAIRAANKGQ